MCTLDFIQGIFQRCTKIETLCEKPCVLSIAVVPVDVIILVHAVELQLKAAEQVLDHDAQVVIEDPGAQTG